MFYFIFMTLEPLPVIYVLLVLFVLFIDNHGVSFTAGLESLDPFHIYPLVYPIYEGIGWCVYLEFCFTHECHYWSD